MHQGSQRCLKTLSPFNAYERIIFWQLDSAKTIRQAFCFGPKWLPKFVGILVIVYLRITVICQLYIWLKTIKKGNLENNEWRGVANCFCVGRGLFWCSVYYDIKQIATWGSAWSVCHSNTYIISFLTRHNEQIYDCALDSALVMMNIHRTWYGWDVPQKLVSFLAESNCRDHHL